MKACTAVHLPSSYRERHPPPPTQTSRPNPGTHQQTKLRDPPALDKVGRHVRMKEIRDKRTNARRKGRRSAKTITGEQRTGLEPDDHVGCRH